jgi:CelD/BcsL family acetyltransferase involved in cellulose biosynthesis
MFPIHRISSMESSGWQLYSGADLHPLESLWRQAHSEHIFQQYELNAAWAAQFAGPSGAGFQLHIWHTASPPMLVPCVVRNGWLSWLGHGLFDYADPLGAPSDFAACPSPSPAAACDIAGIRDNSPWRSQFTRMAPHRAALAPFSAAPYCAAISAAELERRHPRMAERWRELARKGVGWAPVLDPSARQRLLALMLRWKQSRMGARNVLHTLEAAWLAEMASYEGCELWRLGDEADWAGFLTWRFGHTRYGYTLAHDPARAKYSPGAKLLYAVLARSLDQGLRFDFLTGEQDFKLRLATGRVPLWRLESASPVAA